MGSNPIGDRPKDPYEHYKIRIDAIEQGKKRQNGDGEGPKGLSLAAKILQLIRSALDFVLRITGNVPSTDAQMHMREHLLQLKIFFETLKQEERSQDVIFLNELSEVWHRILEESLRLKRHSKASDPVRRFLKDFQEYPPGQEYSFAYYLTEYTGEQWLPFPYIDMIQTIHEEHQKDPLHSALTHWTQEIDQLLELLPVVE